MTTQIHARPKSAEENVAEESADEGAEESVGVPDAIVPDVTGAGVLVTGAAGGVGRRLLRALAADPTVGRIVALDIAPAPGGFDRDRVEFHRASVAMVPLAELLDGVGCIVHLAFATDTERRRRLSEVTNVDGTRRVLEAATAAGVDQLVVLSSAIVYGAWPNNPLPLTEVAAIRPNPDFAYALQQAQREQLAVDWASARAGRALAVLRPCLGLGPDRSPWLARSLAAAAGARLAEDDPPQQYLHLDDLADAVVVARRERLDGVFNVAPDGWISGETVRALAVGRPRLRLPGPLANVIARQRWQFQRGPIPPGLLPYTSHPWVIANDRMKAAGWRPRHTSEQAYVAGTEAKWWTLLTPSRKQELALGAAGAAVVAAAIATALALRRAVRGRSG